MRESTVPDDEDVASQMFEEKAKKATGFFLPDVVRIKVVVQPKVFALGADRDTGDDRDFVMPGSVVKDRSDATWRPGLENIRNQEEPRFVNEGDVGAQPRGVFYTRGQSFRFQCSIFSSFRSRLRRSGF